MSDKKSYMIPGAHLGADPEFFSVWTLYDIGPSSSDNLAQLMNTISNRGQPLLAGVEVIDNQDLTNGLFGKDYSGTHRVWCLKWITSAIGQMTEDTLRDDAEGKLMTTGLAETAKLSDKIVTKGRKTNTFFIRYDSF